MAAIHEKFRRALVNHGKAEKTARDYMRVASRADPHAKADGNSLAVWFVEEVQRKGLSRSTQVQYRSALRYWAKFRGFSVDLPKSRGAKQNHFREALSTKEYAEYVRSVEASGTPVPVRVILLLLPETGLRIEEACGLHWNMHRMTSPTRRSFKIVGKGQKSRIIPLTETAQKILNAYGAWKGAPGTGYLFPSASGRTDHYSPATVRKHLQQLREERGWTGRLATVSPHVLRHTFATRMLDAGVSLKHVSALLGHSDIMTTQRYLHPSEDALQEAVGAMDRKTRKTRKGPG